MLVGVLTVSGTEVTIFLVILAASSSSSLLTKDIFLDLCDLLFTIFMFLLDITGKLELEVELIVELLYKVSNDSSNAGEFTGSLKFMFGRKQDSSVGPSGFFKSGFDSFNFFCSLSFFCLPRLLGGPSLIFSPSRGISDSFEAGLEESTQELGESPER